MNFYALNETPINGWKTLYGVSTSCSLVLQGDGRAANVQLGRGKADLVLQATGRGTVRKLGSAIGSVVIQAAAHGIRGAAGYGLGDVVLQVSALGRRGAVGSGVGDIVLIADGDARVVPPNGGYAAIQLTAEAIGRVATAHHGIGDAPIVLDGVGQGRKPLTVRGNGWNTIHVSPNGGVRLVAYGRGAAEVRINVAGAGRIASRIKGYGLCALELHAWNRGSTVNYWVRGSGKAVVQLEGECARFGAATLPSAWCDAPRDRTMRISHENRVLKVPRNDRAVRVRENA